VDSFQVRAPSVWLRTKSYRWRQDELFNNTLDWIRGDQSLPSEASVTTAVEGEFNEIGRSVERPIAFDVAGEKVWGILHEPIEIRDDAPNIVFIAAGAICRSGVFYPRLARELANSGWRVLRFDPRGMGDSEGFFDCDSVDEVYSKIEAGALVPDTIAALDFLRQEYGSGESVLTGLCGGAITSVFAAAADDRVVGIAPLDLPLKLTLPDGAAQEPPHSQRALWVDYFSQRRGMFFMLTVRRLLHGTKGA
jgi:pimeloyl-ACP methyl ester carboxylesterase